VHYAHERGVIHRDLKPSNIMLGKHGETLVVDWGLAKVSGRSESTSSTASPEPTLHPSSGSDVQPTEAGALVGTLEYMPPEQAEGKIDELDRRSDVYSLGATLYYMLTGRPEVEEADVVDKVRRIATGAITPPRQAEKPAGASFKLDIPKPLEAICRKAMALKSDDRYATAVDVFKDVQQFLAREPVAAYRENLFEKTQRAVRKHRTLATAAAVFLVVLSAAASVLALQQSAHARGLGARTTNWPAPTPT
jgi:serine/threonine protein kinase